MPHGKPAFVRCVQLTDQERCRIFGQPERPLVCASLRPSAEMCGQSRDEALSYLVTLEQLTRPRTPHPVSEGDVPGAVVARF
jgi:uncharacterized protein